MTYRVVVIGDVGATPSFHVGDEAMLETALTEIGARLDVRWTVVSACPEDTARRYGVDAVPGFGFAELGSASERDGRLQQISDIVEGKVELAAGSAAGALLDALADADAVLIAGGGNLNSSWPELIYERTALAQVAHLLGVPLLVSGQSIGPELTRRDGELASAALTGAQLVGVREKASAELALRLGVPSERIWRTCDDAAFMSSGANTDVGRGLDLQAQRYVAVTINSFAGWHSPAEMVDAYGKLLDDIVEITGLDVVLVPHVGSFEGFDGVDHDDMSYHAAVCAAAKSSRIRLAPIMVSAAVAGLTRAAAMVVTNRYHPVVFGLSAAVPTVAVTVDAYTDNKIRGAAELTGMSSWCVSILGLESGVVSAAVREAWTRRAEISERLLESIGPMEKEKCRYWDGFANVLAGGFETPDIPVVDDRPPSETGTARGAWTVRNDDALGWSHLFSIRHSDWRRERDSFELQIGGLSRQLQQERVDRCAAADELVMVNEALAVERAAMRAAQHLNAEMIAKATESADRQAEFQDHLTQAARSVEVLEHQTSLLQRDSEALTALQGSKLVRWSGPARGVYRHLLRVQQDRRTNP